MTAETTPTTESAAEIATAKPTVSVRLFFPRRPETHAYVIPEGMKFYFGRPAHNGGVDGRIVTLRDVPTWSHAERWAWYRRAGARLIHKDGTPWTDADWDRRHPDTAAIDEQIWPRRLSGI